MRSLASACKASRKALLESDDAGSVWSARTRRLVTGEDARTTGNEERAADALVVRAAEALARAEARVAPNFKLCLGFRTFRHAVRLVSHILPRCVLVRNGNIADRESVGLDDATAAQVQACDRNCIVVVPVHPFLLHQMFSAAADAVAQRVSRAFLLERLWSAVRRNAVPVFQHGVTDRHRFSLPLGEAISIPLRHEVLLAEDDADDEAEVRLLPYEWHGSHVVLASMSPPFTNLSKDERKIALELAYSNSLRLAWALRNPTLARSSATLASSRNTNGPPDESACLPTEVVMSCLGSGAAGYDLTYVVVLAIHAAMVQVLEAVISLADAVGRMDAAASTSTLPASSFDAISTALGKVGQPPLISLVTIDTAVSNGLARSRLRHLARPWRIGHPDLLSPAMRDASRSFRSNLEDSLPRFATHETWMGMSDDDSMPSDDDDDDYNSSDLEEEQNGRRTNATLEDSLFHHFLAPDEDENDDNDHGHSALAQHMLDVFNYDDGARARGDLWRLDGG